MTTVIVTSAELSNQNGILPASYYVIEDDTISGPYATEDQARDASEAPAMSLDRLNAFLAAK